MFVCLLGFEGALTAMVTLCPPFLGALGAMATLPTPHTTRSAYVSILNQSLTRHAQIKANMIIKARGIPKGKDGTREGAEGAAAPPTKS